MFETFNQLADAAATNASRRQFLGRLSRGAMAVAAAAGGLLAVGGDAHAARSPRKGCPKGCHPCKHGCCGNGGGRC